jgi:hypothetical protein
MSMENDSSRTAHDREAISGQAEPQYVGWLLLDIGKGCFRSGIQA